MPPRSVCLNVFTTSLGESNTAVNDGNAMMGVMSGMERRDSAQSGMSFFQGHIFTTFDIFYRKAC
jgi:hypothetical protein